MVTVILSPVLAFILHLIDQKMRLSKRLIFIIASFLTIPSFIIWLLGYNFKDEDVFSCSKMLAIASILWILFTFVDKRVVLKAAGTAVITILLSGLVLISSMGKSWSGKRQILTRTIFGNYVALELGPQLHESKNLLRVKKTQLNGFIEKVVFETTYNPIPEIVQCKEYFNDVKRKMAYDFCVKTISSR